MKPIPGRDVQTRERLVEQRKPTIVKSIRSGRYYCGIGITQSERLVFALWARPDRKATSRVTYGVGNTPAQAYAVFSRRAGFMSRLDKIRDAERHREAVLAARQERNRATK